jgi:hypothetical protein
LNRDPSDLCFWIARITDVSLLIWFVSLVIEKLLHGLWWGCCWAVFPAASLEILSQAYPLPWVFVIAVLYLRLSGSREKDLKRITES